MKIKRKNRKFKPSNSSNIILKDCGDITLKNNEQVTFTSTKSLSQNFDITKKSWGYYATPSINNRLLKNNFFSFIVQNKSTKNFFIMIANNRKLNGFYKYLKKENLKIIKWPRELKYKQT